MTCKAFPAGLIIELLCANGHDLSAQVDEGFRTLQRNEFRYYDNYKIPPDADDLAAIGLPPDAIQFDFGQESDNQDDFASLGRALMIALGLMLVLLVVQFRSLIQPLLIFLAIPFSFLGVFTILSLTDNPLSFLVTVGFIALIGVAVNNTILLVDAANRARRG